MEEQLTGVYRATVAIRSFDLAGKKNGFANELGREKTIGLLIDIGG